jgi:hypothetical protein
MIAGLWHFIAKICIFLSFSVSASKSEQSLITAYATITNQFQREFLFNNCIQSQEFFSRLSQCPKKTNFFKPLPAGDGAFFLLAQTRKDPHEEGLWVFNRWGLVLGRLLCLFQQSLDARDESLRGVICPLPLGESLK